MTETKTNSRPYLFYFGFGVLLCTLLYSNIPTINIPDLLLERFTRVTENVPEPISSRDEFIARYQDGCPAHQFESVRVVSRAPDIMLIEGFLTEQESQVLLRAAEPHFADSSVVKSGDDVYNLDKSYRDSWSAFLHYPDPSSNPEDAVINCIEERATAFQGHVPRVNMEGLQVVKYYENQHYKQHYDWFYPDGPDMNSGNRITSFFVYLVANCTGGTTIFPKVSRPQGEEWCDALKCRNEDGSEVQWMEVKPKVGTAIFWYNLDKSGEGDVNTLHTGSPVKEGIKVGLNVWTRQKNFRER